MVRSNKAQKRKNAKSRSLEEEQAENARLSSHRPSPIWHLEIGSIDLAAHISLHLSMTLSIMSPRRRQRSLKRNREMVGTRTTYRTFRTAALVPASACSTLGSAGLAFTFAPASLPMTLDV